MSIPTNDNPQLFDRVQAELIGALEENISWLTKAYPLAERLVRDSDGAEVVYPAVRSLGNNDDQYLSMFPDTDLGNYCFIEDNGNETYDSNQSRRNSTSITQKSISIIFWFDYRRVYPDNHATRTIENVKYEVLDTLRRYPFKVFKARLQDASSLVGDVFSGYDYNIIETQYNMRPYGMLRITLDISYDDGCLAELAPIVTLPMSSYIQSDWDETDDSLISFIQNKPISLGGGTGLEAIDEGNGIGWRLVGRDPENYGNIGLESVDFSIGTSPSTTFGATGAYSFALGINSIASGFGSVAWGQVTIASNTAATSFGSETVSSGGYSLATGFRTTASGASSFVSGYQNTASSDSQTTLGRFSIDGIGQTSDGFVSTDELFKLGNGLSDGSRSNALLILKNGTITAPSLTTALITDSKTLATKEYVDLAANIKAIILEEPTDAEDIGIMYTSKELTLLSISGVLLNGTDTPSLDYTIRYATDRSALGTEVVIGGDVITSTTTGTITTVFDNAVVPEGNYLWLETTGQTGTTPYLELFINFN